MFVDDHWAAVRCGSGRAPGRRPAGPAGVVDPRDRLALPCQRRSRGRPCAVLAGDPGHHGPGADLARVLETRPDGPVDRADGSTDCSAEATTASVPLWANTLIDSLQARQSLMAHLQARQQADLAELSGCYPACTSSWPPRSPSPWASPRAPRPGKLAEAVDLTTRLPETFAALTRAGSPRSRHPPSGPTPRIWIWTSPPWSRPTSCRQRPGRPCPNCDMPCSARSSGTTPRRRRPASGPRERAGQRQGPARRDGQLWLLSTAQDVATIQACLVAVGDAAASPDDGRTADARRVDAMVDLCAEVLDSGQWRGTALPTRQRRRPHVQVTVPITALLDPATTAGQSAELHGYGPITAAQAAQITADATLRRLVCDPLTERCWITAGPPTTHRRAGRPRAGPRPDLPAARLPTARAALRARPRRTVPPRPRHRRNHQRDQSVPGLQTPPPGQGRRRVPSPAHRRRLRLDQPAGPPLRQPPTRLWEPPPNTHPSGRRRSSPPTHPIGRSGTTTRRRSESATVRASTGTPDSRLSRRIRRLGISGGSGPAGRDC